MKLGGFIVMEHVFHLVCAMSIDSIFMSILSLFFLGGAAMTVVVYASVA